MPKVTYEEINPSPVANTTAIKVFADGIHKTTRITTNEGYVLHDNTLDIYAEYDGEGNGIGDLILGFYSGTRSVRYDYDFVVNPREFYTVLVDEVPEGAEIFNVPSGGNHEVV